MKQPHQVTFTEHGGIVSKVIITDHGFPSINVERDIIEAAGHTIADAQPVCKTEEAVIEQCGDADVLLVQWAPITRRVLASLPKVKCIVRYGIGVNNFDLAAAKELGVIAANVPDYCVDEVSTHATTLILSLGRRVPQDNHQMRNGGWGIGPFLPIPAFSDLTLGLLGFGNIARLVAQKAKAFGFNVIASDPFVKDSTFAEAEVTSVSFDTLLETSDILSLHCPLVPATTHLINADAIAKMKRGVLLVNTSRGPVIQEEDFIQGVQSGKIGGAALDVFETEPLSPDSPLRRLPSNVLLTSHAASYSESAETNLRVKAAEAARDFLQGKRPRSVVAG
jgi:D-3-phosphoglycerate dehydrogenase